ncbi:hypothetical protein HNR08_001666 [Cellulomonas hominis]|uniref:Uncharacterized protein n=1 Tax=Cellulomonas hominis TaxID=156981 RepID=A0A7W8SD97_9CELL|nr:hypothetical protein [Cellulomonas hominis]
MMTASGQFSVSRGTGARGSTDVPSGRLGLRLGGRIVRRGVVVVGTVRAHCVPARRALRLRCVLHGRFAVRGPRAPRTEAMRGGPSRVRLAAGAAPSIVDAVRRVGDRAKGGRARLRRAASPCSLGMRGVVERSGRGRGYRCRRFWETASRGSTAGVGGRVAVSLPEPGAGRGDPAWSRVPEGARCRLGSRGQPWGPVTSGRRPEREWSCAPSVFGGVQCRVVVVPSGIDSANARRGPSTAVPARSACGQPNGRGRADWRPEVAGAARVALSAACLGAWDTLLAC